MPFNLGGGELVFILVIVLIVFGAGRLPDVFAQLGKGVRTFRDESSGATSTATASGPAAMASTSGSPKHCLSCGKPLADGAKFCANCGTPVQS